VRALVFGSSIAEGYWATQGGWVQRLIDDVARYHVENGQGATEGDWVMNVGIGGDTVRRVIDRFPAEARARAGLGAGELAVVFAIGANDSMRIAGRELSTPQRFREDLAELHRLARELTDRVMFVGFTAMDPDGEATRQFFDLARVREFQQVLTRFALDSGSEFVEVMEEFQVLLDTGHLLLVDGVHPNDAGHEVIYRQVKPVLARWLATLA
jgi:lysophospholipase L1-like esterase